MTINAIGAFVLDEKSNLVWHRLFFPDLELSSSVLEAIVDGLSNDDTVSLVSDLVESGFNEVVSEDQMMARALAKSGEIDVTLEETSVIKWFRQNQQDYLKDLEVDATKEEITEFVRSASLQLAKSRVSAAIEERDLLIKNAVDAVDEIDKSINILVMRLREWYSLHHPTLSQVVDDQEAFTHILMQCCGKSVMNQECLKKTGTPDAIIDAIIKAEADVGAPMKDEDLRAIQGLADTIGQMFQRRGELEGYVTGLMEEVAPNMSHLAGPLIGARLISTAGSLKELARKPSSTIQVYGAERALFRSIKTGAAPPKHGIIYRVPEINTSPYWIRGKVARALAGKLSIAARIDAYSDTDMGDELRKDFLTRLEEIKRQNPDPPKETKPPPKPQTGRRRRPSKSSRGKRRKGGRS